jgi:transcriptional regulator with XRE-family HTH domain
LAKVRELKKNHPNHCLGGLAQRNSWAFPPERFFQSEKEKRMRKRSQEKRITREAKIIRFMRVSKRISQREAARLLGISEPAIGHYENGRMDISQLRLGQFLVVYGFTKQEFDEFVAGKEIPIISIKNKCIELLNQINKAKLHTIHTILIKFIS